MKIVAKFLIISIILTFVIILVVQGVSYALNEFEFSKLPAVRQEATLISCSFQHSTLGIHAVPVLSPDGKMSTALYYTGHDEKYVTVWDCGPYGKLACTSKRVFKNSKPVAILYIKSNHYDTRIVGIE